MNKKYIIYVVIATIAIPIFFNFFLPIETGMKILGEEKSNIIWLSFWGTYLAALGSFFLGWIALQINKESIKQNEKILHNYGWEHLVNRYNHIEEFVLNEESVHHPTHIDELIAYLKKGDDTSFHLQLSNWRKDVNLSSLRIIRYMNDDVLGPKDNELIQYGLALRNINDKASEIIEVFCKKLSQEETEIELENLRMDMLNKFSNLMSTAFYLLQHEKRMLHDEANKYNIPCGII